MVKGKARERNTPTKGKPPATGSNQDKKQSTGSKSKTSVGSKNLSLYLSREYVAFKAFAHEFSIKLQPLGLSITQVGAGLANYKARSFTFGLDEDVVRNYAHYTALKSAWESLRDSFRVERESATISAEDLEDLVQGASSVS